MERNTQYKEIARELIARLEETLENKAYNSADLSDVGNEVGFVVGKYFDNKVSGLEESSFMFGLRHGFDLSKQSKQKK